MLPKSSSRFGTVSHHSFFSRHNPHPHRVRHIQGLSGRPICMVRDDWLVTSSLFPHPLLKSHVTKKAAEPAFLPAQNLYGVGAGRDKNKSVRLSEAWRDELKELAAKVNLLSQGQKDKNKGQPEEEFLSRKTQHSADTGRIIPPSTKSYQRRSHYQHMKNHPAFLDQELTILELLCQILQTDSLSAVKQWLLLACQREKDLVMGMIRRINLSDRNQHFQGFQCPPRPVCGSFFEQPRRHSSLHRNQKFSVDKPDLAS
ncbi:protein TBATA [Pholidichthys leucotaenia]